MFEHEANERTRLVSNKEEQNPNDTNENENNNEKQSEEERKKGSWSSSRAFVTMFVVLVTSMFVIYMGFKDFKNTVTGEEIEEDLEKVSSKKSFSRREKYLQFGRTSLFRELVRVSDGKERERERESVISSIEQGQKRDMISIVDPIERARARLRER